MQREPDSYDLKALADLTGVAPRTVHFYVQQGLLPPPDGAGRGARYTGVHRDRLRLIRRLQDQHLPLSEIRKHLDGIPDSMLEAVASAPPTPKPKTAADYIRSVLSSGTPVPSAPPQRPDSRPTPGFAFASRAPVDDSLSSEPPALRQAPMDRSQWERFIVHPDVELHVRRPSSRATNRKIDKLVDLARTLFKEDA